MRKKFLTGATVLALLMSTPPVSADDDIIIFGGEFDDDVPVPKEVTKPAPTKELPPPAVKESEPEPVEEPVKPIEPERVEQPIEQPTEPERVEPPPAVKESEPVEEPVKPIEPERVEQPIEQPVEPEVVEPPLEETLPEIEQPFPSTKISGDRIPAPVEVSPRLPAAPASEHTTTRRPKQNDELTEPVVPVEPIEEPVKILPPPSQPTIRESMRRSSTSSQSLKTLKPRFVKLAVDDTYTYYLDKTSVQWKRMPYSASEYMADVWIRMVERQPKNLDADMAAYGNENFNAEISLAREQGYQYAPEDLQVLRSQAYVLEHYYLRPKTKQIQFLCELEVFGRPQNTVNERAYDYRNWENLVPGSVESAIYKATIKIIGKSGSSERGHMTFFDMLDEYARIALN